MSNLYPHPFAYLDVETTGLSAWFGDRICEIAILRCEGDRVTATFDSLVNPDRPLSPGAARVNGLKDEELKDAPRFEEIIGSVQTMIRDAVIVCHNAPFDLSFLSSEFNRLNQPLPATLFLDTLEIARSYFNFPSNSLQAIANRLRIDVRGAHRALDDVLTTREILRSLTANLSAPDIERLIRTYHPPSGSTGNLNLPPQIVEALQSRKKLRIHYVDRKGDVSLRTVTPSQVITQNNSLYLVAFCHLREEERHFRLDRIESMDVEPGES